MDSKTTAPSFTVSLRGYDREEVDEYLDSLGEALNQVEEAEAHTRRLQAHVSKCNARIKELEDRIRADTPKSGIALGERIGILLNQAEETAADVVSRAETEAARIVADAEARSKKADEMVRSATARAEEQARRIDTQARGEASNIVSEAEARAAARTRQIEQWAEQVVSHTRAEEARLLREQQQAKEVALAELRDLSDQRGRAVGSLNALREALGRAAGLVEKDPAGTAVASATRAAQDTAQHAAPAQSNGVGAPAGTADDETGSADQAGSAEQAGSTNQAGASNQAGAGDQADTVHQAGSGDPEGEHLDPTVASLINGGATESDQFEAKLDAWVAGGTDHRRD
jgi:DivIVA domain-containing protein